MAKVLVSGRVLRAYTTSCAVCNLRHGRLLNAAHITADSQDQRDVVVSNGLSPRKIHHAAYDAQLLGITVDYSVQIKRALLEEIDGPMLTHGLQKMHGRTLIPPGSSPQPSRPGSTGSTLGRV